MVRAQEVWHAIVEAQVETGTPFMVFKDACNRKSNHQHLGTIQSSNLCTEVVEYSSPDEVSLEPAPEPAPAFELLLTLRLSFSSHSRLTFTCITVQVAVCNLASIALNKFVITNPATGKPEFDFAMLQKVTALIVRNLNKVIEVNFYPVPEVFFL